MVKTRKNIVYKVERVEGVGSNEHYDMVKKLVNNKVVERKIFTPREMKNSVRKTIQRMKKNKNKIYGGKTERNKGKKNGKKGKKNGKKVKIVYVQQQVQPPVQQVQPMEPAQVQVADNTTFMQAAKVGAADMAGRMFVLGAIGAVMGDSDE